MSADWLEHPGYSAQRGKHLVSGFYSVYLVSDLKHCSRLLIPRDDRKRPFHAGFVHIFSRHAFPPQKGGFRAGTDPGIIDLNDYVLLTRLRDFNIGKPYNPFILKNDRLTTHTSPPLLYISIL